MFSHSLDKVFKSLSRFNCPGSGFLTPGRLLALGISSTLDTLSILL